MRYYIFCIKAVHPYDDLRIIDLSWLIYTGVQV